MFSPGPALDSGWPQLGSGNIEGCIGTRVSFEVEMYCGLRAVGH
jgi:hypothetical protein